MSKSIDEKVVSMKMDSADFEKNAEKSIGILNKLKQSLSSFGSKKYIEGIGDEAKRVDFSPLANGVDVVKAKFSALQIAGMTAIANITNSAINAGKNIASALTIDPIKTGFQEYETQMNAVQTILANTKSKGSTLNDVNKALGELNTYADKTIYNFTEMTRNIGTFTAAGVDLDKSVTSIKGIANLAAVSGSTSQQASTAMYQLSQALAAGKVQLMDWNSVVNAGMGGEVFQTALKRTAKQMGKDVDGLIEKYGSFRESLTKGEWLTSDVLTETLTQLSGAYTEADLLQKGYTKEQAKDILDLADTAVKAATKVKTVTQLWDTLKEAAQSGWTQSWQIIIGDFEEAKELLSGISDVVSDWLNKQSEARNNLLQGWKDLGGRTALLESFKNIISGIGSVIKPISEAFRDIFPPMTAKRLFELTDKFREFTSKLKLSDDNAKKLKETFKGLFSIASIIGQGLGAIFKPFSDWLGNGVASNVLSSILDITSAFGGFFTKLNEDLKVGKGLTNLSENIANALEKISNTFRKQEKEPPTSNGPSMIDVMMEKAKTLLAKIQELGKAVLSPFKTLYEWIRDNVRGSDVLGGAISISTVAILSKFEKFMSRIRDMIEDAAKFIGGAGGKHNIGEFFDQLHNSLKSFATGLKVASLIGISIAVTMLVSSIRRLSEIEPDKLMISIGAIAALMKILGSGFKGLSKTLSIFNPTGTLEAAAALVSIGDAIKKITESMVTLKGMSFEDIIKGLVGIYGALFGLSKSMGIMGGKGAVSLRTSASIFVMAKSLKDIVKFMKDVSSMNWDSIKKGLVGLTGSLGAMAGVNRILSKVSGRKAIAGAVSIFIISKSLSKIAKGLALFGDMDWDDIKKGLVGMGGALTEISALNTISGKIAGVKNVFAALGTLITSKSLGNIANGLIEIGNMDWDDIKKGLVGMGGALTEISALNTISGKIAGVKNVFAALGTLITSKSLGNISTSLEKIGKLNWETIGRGLAGLGGALTEISALNALSGSIAGFSNIFASLGTFITSKSLDEIITALEKIGGLTWATIERGLVGLGGALSEIAIIEGSLGSLAGFSSIIASVSTWLTSQSFDEISEALKNIGSMSWDEIKKGLVGLGGALSEIAIIEGSLGKLAGLESLAGSGATWITSQSFDEVVSALKDIGSMNWEEIKKGLTGLGLALGETGLGAIFASMSGMGSFAIWAMAKPIGDLAESVKKWKDVEVPIGLPFQLGLLAAGVASFTFSLVGGFSISTVAESMGVLAESMKKWKDVKIPTNIAKDLGTLADGVTGFTLAFFGSKSIKEVAKPLGQLADSVTKWNTVTIPEDLSSKMENLAKGISKFDFTWSNGGTMESVVDPLANMAGAVEKWANVKIDTSLGKSLESLADGINSFGTKKFWEKLGIEEAIKPLSDLTTIFSKWNGITLPTGIGTSLMSMADGIKEFEGITLDNFASETIATALANIRTTVDTLTKLTNFNPETLNNLVTGMNSIGQMSLNGLTESINNGVAQIGPAIQTMMSTIINTLQTAIPSVVPPSKAIGTAIATNIKVGLDEAQVDIQTSVSGITAKITESINSKVTDFGIAGVSISTAIATGMKTGLDPLPTIVSDVVQKAVSAVSGTNADFGPIGIKMAESLANGISAGGGAVRGKIDGIMNACVQAAESKLGSFSKAGSTMMDKLSSGITSKASGVKSAVKEIVDGAVSVAKKCYSDFSSAGGYAAQGFADGIASKAQAAAQEAAKMVTDAINAAKKAADINSPSRKFRALGEFSGEGYVIGIDSYQDKAYQSGKDMANASMNGLRKSINNITDYVSDNIDARPVISPVLDLSQLSKQSKGVGRILDLNPSLSASNLSRTTRFGRSNRNPNSDIVSALKDLKQSVVNNAGNTYVIDGITYDDGSNVSNAVQALIRHTRIEGRV